MREFLSELKQVGSFTVVMVACHGFRHVVWVEDVTRIHFRVLSVWALWPMVEVGCVSCLGQVRFLHEVWQAEVREFFLVFLEIHLGRRNVSHFRERKGKTCVDLATLESKLALELRSFHQIVNGLLEIALLDLVISFLNQLVNHFLFVILEQNLVKSCLEIRHKIKRIVSSKQILGLGLVDEHQGGASVWEESGPECLICMVSVDLEQLQWPVFEDHLHSSLELLRIGFIPTDEFIRVKNITYFLP